MGQRKIESLDYWLIELNYIKYVQESKNLSSFNNDFVCFANYVKMQSEFARKDGFNDISADMIQCVIHFLGDLDIKEYSPNFTIIEKGE